MIIQFQYYKYLKNILSLNKYSIRFKPTSSTIIISKELLFCNLFLSF